MSSTGPPPLTAAIALPFAPTELAFSAAANKSHVIGIEGGDGHKILVYQY
jgi:hypothetical protein